MLAIGLPEIGQIGGMETVGLGLNRQPVLFVPLLVPATV
jgi:hypothetical protein